MVIVDGPIVTAGAAFAQTDLTLHLLRDRFGVALADAVSRVLLIDGRQAQTPCVTPMMFAAGNDLVLESSRYSVEQVAERVGYSDATALRRLLRKTVGATPRQLRPQSVA